MAVVCYGSCVLWQLCVGNSSLVLCCWDIGSGCMVVLCYWDIKTGCMTGRPAAVLSGYCEWVVCMYSLVP